MSIEKTLKELEAAYNEKLTCDSAMNPFNDGTVDPGYALWVHTRFTEKAADAFPALKEEIERLKRIAVAAEKAWAGIGWAGGFQDEANELYDALVLGHFITDGERFEELDARRTLKGDRDDE